MFLDEFRAGLEPSLGKVKIPDDIHPSSKTVCILKFALGTVLGSM